MTTKDLIARLRVHKDLSLCHEAADALEALGREVAELKEDRDEWKDSTIAANRNAASEEAKRREVQEQRDTLRAELADIGAQQPVSSKVLKQLSVLIALAEGGEAPEETTLAKANSVYKEAVDFSNGHKKLLSDDERCGDKSEQIRDGENMDQWAIRVGIDASPAAKDAGLVPDGWKLVMVKDLEPLVDSLDRADRKGYMPDAIADEWEAFDWLTYPPKFGGV